MNGFIDALTRRILLYLYSRGLTTEPNTVLNRLKAHTANGPPTLPGRLRPINPSRFLLQPPDLPFAFALRMQISASRNPPSQPSSGHPSRSQNRLSSDMKGRAPLPVPSGPQHLQQNGHSRNPSGYDMAARSPPNQSSKPPVRCLFMI